MMVVLTVDYYICETQYFTVLTTCLIYFFFLMIRRPPRSTLFPTRRSSDLQRPARGGSAEYAGRPALVGRCAGRRSPSVSRGPRARRIESGVARTRGAEPGHPREHSG